MHTNARIDSGHPYCLHDRRECGRLCRPCRASWQEARVAVAVGPSFLHWVNTSHLSSQVESRWPAWGHALTCNQWCVPAAASLLGWDVESRCWRGAPRAAQFFPLRQLFEGWCSPRCSGPRAAPSRCCGDGVFVVGAGVGASRGVPASNEHEDGRPVALKTA